MSLLIRSAFLDRRAEVEPEEDEDVVDIDESNAVDLADVAAPLQSEAPLKQGEVSIGVSQATLDRDFALETMRKIPTHRITLARLERLYEARRPGRLAQSEAIRIMQKPQKVTIDQEYLRRPSDPDLSYFSITSHIDALMIVPSNIGLAAILPARRPNQSFSLQLSLTRLSRPFTAKDGYFGFDPHKALMWVGRYACDAVWVALADNVPEDAPPDTQPYRGRVKEAIVDRPVAHMILMFFAYSLSVAAVADIHISGVRYPRNVETIDCVKNNTNLL